MTLLTILAAAAALSVVLTLGLLWRGARKVERLPHPRITLAMAERLQRPSRWHESGEAVE